MCSQDAWLAVEKSTSCESHSSSLWWSIVRAELKVVGVGLDQVNLGGNSDTVGMLKLRKIASLTEFMRNSNFLCECQTPRFCGKTFRNRGKIFVVQLVSLAAESRKAYIPSPLKRWYGIGAQPRLSSRSILCDCFNIMIQIILKVIKQAKVLCALWRQCSYPPVTWWLREYRKESVETNGVYN